MNLEAPQNDWKQLVESHNSGSEVDREGKDFTDGHEVLQAGLNRPLEEEPADDTHRCRGYPLQPHKRHVSGDSACSPPLLEGLLASCEGCIQTGA